MRFAMHLLLWGCIIGYVCVAASYCGRKRDTLLCKGVRVTVRDSLERGFVTAAMVRGWFIKEGMKFRDEELYSINTAGVKKFVAGRGFVKDVNVYTSSDGYVNITLSQREPEMRVQRSAGESFYVADDGFILPVQKHFTVYVPVVTGDFPLPFPDGYVGYLEESVPEGQKKLSKSYLFLYKLINFVKFVNSDPFWRDQIVQINVAGEGPGMTGGGTEAPEPFSEGLDYQVEIVPRAGEHVIMLGSLDGFKMKLDKLNSFYRNGLRYVGWDSVGYINLRYEGQVVCTR